MSAETLQDTPLQLDAILRRLGPRLAPPLDKVQTSQLSAALAVPLLEADPAAKQIIRELLERPDILRFLRDKGYSLLEQSRSTSPARWSSHF
jgi:hypothetical protein